MPDIKLFVEDRGHEAFLQALVDRLATQYHLSIERSFPSARGGHGTVISKLKNYIADLKDKGLPDLLIVAIDGNCKGYTVRKQEIEHALKGYPGQVIYAIPDPHVERWYLLDSAAFKSALGKGCSAPAQKCDRDRYKRLLLEVFVMLGFSLL